MSASEDHDPVDVFADVARLLATESSVTETLQRITALAVETVPGTEQASVSVVSRRHVETVAATDDVCRRVDDVQYETGQGPCLDALHDRDVVRIDDLSDTEEWPEFAQRAADLGIRSMLSFRLFLGEDTLGALNLYATRPAAMTADAERLGQVFAAHAAVAWDHAQETQGLQEAASTRNLIGQAQGLLMAQRGCSPDEAFRLLASASQRSNTKLRDVALRLVEGNADAPRPGPPPD